MYYNYNTMNNEIKKLVITSMFLAVCGALSIFQIPLPFIASYAGFDLAIIPLLLSRRFVGLTKSIVIALIYPFFTLISVIPNFIGVLFLMMQSTSIVLIDFIFNNKKYNIFGIIISIVLITIISVIINIFIIMPLYVGEHTYWSNPIPNIVAAIFTSVTITSIRLMVGYALTWPLWTLFNSERFKK